MSKIQLTIDTNLLKKSGLTHIQYLILAYLREDTNITYKPYSLPIIKSLEDLGYIRIIDNHIIIDSKIEELFNPEITKKAKELLAFYNDLKKDHLGITRQTTADKYIVKFKRLLQNEEFEFIKEVLNYIFTKWKIDPFWLGYLSSIDTIVRNYEKEANNYELSLVDKVSNKNTML